MTVVGNVPEICRTPSTVSGDKMEELPPIINPVADIVMPPTADIVLASTSKVPLSTIDPEAAQVGPSKMSNPAVPTTDKELRTGCMVPAGLAKRLLPRPVAC